MSTTNKYLISYPNNTAHFTNNGPTTKTKISIKTTSKQYWQQQQIIIKKTDRLTYTHTHTRLERKQICFECLENLTLNCVKKINK